MGNQDHRQNQEQVRLHNKPVIGSLFFATVVSADPATYHIMVAPQGTTKLHKMQGRQLSTILCNAVGFKLSYMPTTGSTVFCYCSGLSECIILGMAPTNDTGEITPFSTRTVIGAGDGLKSAGHRVGYGTDLDRTNICNLGKPTDLLQGELAISNEFGVLLGLFQQFAALKGSELSQVQCFLLDDMVRIISHNFEHYHSMGQFSISHDQGQLLMEAGFTHDPKEALGIPQVSAVDKSAAIDHIGTTKVDDTEDYYKLTGDERSVAIERLKVFVGRLGDFVNLMLVVPAEERRKLDGTTPTKFDSGVLQVKANLDGLFILRSVKGVIIEKTNWIRVPHRVRTNEDPLGDEEINTEPQPDFTFDNTYQAAGQPFLYYLQLRDYLSYIQEGSGYRHFKDKDQDFVVNDEKALERDLSGLTYVDPVTGAAYLKKTSTVALMPNGGVSMRDAWSSAINMEGGNIYIQPAKDLVLQPMRHLVGKIGGNIAIAARKDIDLSSTKGGLRVKTEQAHYLYSARGGIVLHTDAKQIGDEGFLPGSDDEQPVAFISGIVLKAPDAGIFTNAKVGYNLYDRLVTDARINQMNATEELKLFSDKNLEMFSANAYLTSSEHTFCHSKGVATFIGEKETEVSKKGQTFAFALVNGKPAYPVEGRIPDDQANNFFAKMDELITAFDEFQVSDLIPMLNTKDNFDKVLFRFPDSKVYGRGDSLLIPQTLLQQEDASFDNLHGLTVWEEAAVNDTYPFPGVGSSEQLIGKALNNVGVVDGELIPKTKDHVVESVFDKPLNIFDSYRVYNL